MNKKIKGIITGATLLAALSAFAVQQPLSAKITTEKALEIAKIHAKASKDAALDKIKLDSDNGKTIYEVSFNDGSKKFDYEIDANTGEVLNFSEEEVYRYSYNENVDNRYTDKTKKRLSRDQIVKIALEKVKGAKQSDISKLALDVDHGYEVYEVVIYLNNVRYEFDLNSQTGEIVSWEEETVKRK